MPNSLKPKIVYTNDLPRENEFFEIFQTTGWNQKYNLTSSELKVALHQSWYCLSAYHDEKLVGFGRILCDGVVHALILDLIVLPDYQRHGIGQSILDHLVNRCKTHKIRDIQLFSAKGYSRFYKNRGFKERPEDAPGMEYQVNDN